MMQPSNVSMQQMKKLFGPTLLCLEPPNVSIQQKKICTGVPIFTWSLPIFTSCMSLPSEIVLHGLSPLSVLDRPRIELKNGRCSGLDSWIVPAFCSGFFPHRALKQGGVPDWLCGSSPFSVCDCPCIEP